MWCVPQQHQLVLVVCRRVLQRRPSLLFPRSPLPFRFHLPSFRNLSPWNQRYFSCQMANIRSVKIDLILVFCLMDLFIFCSPEEELLAQQLAAAESAVTEKGNFIAKLKEQGADKAEIVQHANEYQQLRGKVDDLRKQLEMPRRLDINKGTFDGIMKRRFFFSPAFGIYGGVSGLYDLGPPGCAMKANTINIWRKHFVVAEGMFEVDTTGVTPFNVLKCVSSEFLFFFS
jgi:hypothetical protein